MNLFVKKEERENLLVKKSLVIYFSHTGENYMSDGIRNIEKGNTEIAAEFIRDITGADLFKVEPVNLYPYEYNKCCDVAKQELNNDVRPEIKNKIDNINDYEVIYIGSPIWWGHMAMPMFTALENLNFEGKIVKLFITHEGSALGNCIKDVEKLCSGAKIMKGLPIRGSNAKDFKSIIESWIKE